MNHDMAIVTADELREFCISKTSCNRCPFGIKINVCETDCKLHFPCNWNIADLTEKIGKQTAKIAEREADK